MHGVIDSSTRLAGPREDSLEFMNLQGDKQISTSSNTEGLGNPKWNSNNADVSRVDSKKVLRKMDLHIIPILTILYLLCFLDRGNIGNAKIEGLSEELHLTGSQYNWCCMQMPLYLMSHGQF